jgi:hypothetical protein
MQSDVERMKKEVAVACFKAISHFLKELRITMKKPRKDN